MENTQKMITWILLMTSTLCNQAVVCSENESGPTNDYIGSHNAFLWKYFDKPAEYRIDDRNSYAYGDNYGKSNDKYRQISDDEQFEKVSHYDRASDDIRSLSGKRTQESQQNSKNCKIIMKGEMECKVCRDSYGTHFKSCTVISAPTKQKYEYTKQRLTAYNIEGDDKKKKDDSEDDLPEYY